MVKISQITPLLDKRQAEVLDQIRATYGNTTQILVSNEELCELAAVCAKFPRYSNPEQARIELHAKAVDEVADVLIILDHIVNIFQLDPLEIRYRINGKVQRIERWLQASNSQEQTLKDREVQADIPKAPCGTCMNFGDFQNLKPGNICSVCVQEPYANYYPKLEVDDVKNDPRGI